MRRQRQDWDRRACEHPRCDGAKEHATHAAQRLGAHDDQVCVIFPGGRENFRIRFAGADAALDRQCVDVAPRHSLRQQHVEFLIRLFFQPISLRRQGGCLRQQGLQHVQHRDGGRFLPCDGERGADERPRVR
jgi:hypothetical protein